MPLARIPNTPGSFLWTNPLSVVWITEIRGRRGCQCSSIPKLAALAPLGAVGYGLSLPGRVFFLAVTILVLVKEFFEILISRQFDQFAPKMKIRAMVLLGSLGEVVSAAIGCTVVGVPLAYMFDEWIQSNQIIRDNSLLGGCNGGWMSPDRNQRPEFIRDMGDRFGIGGQVADPEMAQVLQNSIDDQGGAPPPAPKDKTKAAFMLAKGTLQRYCLGTAIDNIDPSVLIALFQVKDLEQLVIGGRGMDPNLETSWNTLIENPIFNSLNVNGKGELKKKLYEYLLKTLLLGMEGANPEEWEQVLISTVKTQMTEDLAALSQDQRLEIEKLVSNIKQYSEKWRTAHRQDETGILSAVFS